MGLVYFISSSTCYYSKHVYIYWDKQKEYTAVQLQLPIKVHELL